MRKLKIDFVSDVACPWCAIGLHSLERALDRTRPDGIDAELHFQPFELNPSMPADGADTVQYLSAKYGIGPEQIAHNQAAIRQRGAEVGFAFGQRARVWNTFDAHRLLHWARVEAGAEAERRLAHALFAAYHGQGRNPGARELLLELVDALGLDHARAAQVLEGDAFAAEVRAAERQWQDAGIHSVPALVVDGRHLIQGAQKPEVFEQVLRRLAAQA